MSEPPLSSDPYCTAQLLDLASTMIDNLAFIELYPLPFLIASLAPPLNANPLLCIVVLVYQYE